jgi:hypothetical protein
MVRWSCRLARRIQSFLEARRRSSNRLSLVSHDVPFLARFCSDVDGLHPAILLAMANIKAMASSLARRIKMHPT